MLLSEIDTNRVQESKKMKILILGGTSFLGPHQIKYALERGHSVSIFTRGKTKSTVHPEVFDKVEHLIGDRNNNLKALETGELTAREYNNYQKIVKEREFLANKETTNAARHFAQTKKRELQREAAALRTRLSRGKK